MNFRRMEPSTPIIGGIGNETTAKRVEFRAGPRHRTTGTGIITSDITALYIPLNGV